MKLSPDQPVPALAVDTLAGTRFDIAKQAPRNFTQIVFYRGLHCPICKGYLKSIDSRLADFEEHGIETIAISMDGRDRAAEMAKGAELRRLAIGYGLPEATARAWGLYRRGPSCRRRPRICSPSRGCSWCGPTGDSTTPRC